MPGWLALRPRESLAKRSRRYVHRLASEDEAVLLFARGELDLCVGAKGRGGDARVDVLDLDLRVTIPKSVSLARRCGGLIISLGFL